MKIDVTKKQYWDLMRGMYMADWVANAICEADMKRDEDIKETRNYLFSFAKEMGLERYVEYDKELGEYFATFDMDDESVTRSLIERFEEHSAWDELSSWLGDRDFFTKYTQEEIKKMTKEEYFMKRMECEDVWEEEFTEYGIDRLKIDENKK